MPRIPNRYYLWQILKVFIFAKFAKWLRSQVAATGFNFAKKFAVIIALFGAAVVGKIVGKLIDYVMWKAFKFDPLCGMDEMFIHHSPDSPPNVSMMIATEKFEYEKMRDFLKNTNKKVPRLTHKIAQVFGKLYFVPLTDKEYESQQDIIFPRVDGIHTQEQLEQYLASVITQEFDIFNSVVYKYILIPDYSETESRIIMICSHCVGDSVSFYSMLAALQNDFSILPKVTPPSPWMILLSEIIAPLSVAQLLFEYFTFDRNRNSILRAYQPSKDRYIKVLEMPFDKLKEKCKEHKASINSACQALASQTIKEYFVRKGDTKTQGITFSSTFSLRNLPTCMEEFELYNDWVPMTYTLPIREKFEDAVAETKALASKLVGGRFLIASRYFISLSVCLPFGLSQKLFEFYTSPISFSYSNMPGPKKHFKFGDTKLHYFHPVGPTIGKLATSMIVSTMDGKTSIGIITCRGYIEEPEEFIAIF